MMCSPFIFHKRNIILFYIHNDIFPFFFSHALLWSPIIIHFHNIPPIYAIYAYVTIETKGKYYYFSYFVQGLFFYYALFFNANYNVYTQRNKHKHNRKKTYPHKNIKHKILLISTNISKIDFMIFVVVILTDNSFVCAFKDSFSLFIQCSIIKHKKK